MNPVLFFIGSFVVFIVVGAALLAIGSTMIISSRISREEEEARR